MNISLGRIFGISAAAVALTVFGFTAQAQMKKEDKAAPKPPVCSKIKDAAACKARDDCVWTDEVKNDKGKVTKKATCKAKPKPKPEKKK